MCKIPAVFWPFRPEYRYTVLTSSLSSQKVACKHFRSFVVSACFAVSSRYKLDSQPWVLEIGGKSGRHFKGIREGGAGQNADYWIFKKTGEGKFDALPIEEWYNFMPMARYKTLDIDEAEEQFEKRNKVMNQFALKAQILKDGAAKAEEAAEMSAKQMKISDRDEYASDESDDEDAEEKRALKQEEKEGGTSKTKKGKEKGKGGGGGKKGGKRGKKKKEAEEGEDPAFDRESEDGEEEGREVDYMSDSGSESDPMEAPEEEKVDEKGVNDESGLRRLLSDNEEEEEEEEDKTNTPGNTQNLTEEAQKKEAEGDKESDSDDSDSDDPDVVGVKSALFLQDKTVKATEKRGLDDSATESGPSTKKPKVEPPTESSHPSGITEEDVKRYLIRKPMSTKDLLAKLKPKAKSLSKEQLVKRLADIMKQLNPKKEKVERKGKTVLVFSLSG